MIGRLWLFARVGGALFAAGCATGPPSVSPPSLPEYGASFASYLVTGFESGTMEGALGTRETWAWEATAELGLELEQGPSGREARALIAVLSRTTSLNGAPPASAPGGLVREGELFVALDSRGRVRSAAAPRIAPDVAGLSFLALLARVFFPVFPVSDSRPEFWADTAEWVQSEPAQGGGPPLSVTMIRSFVSLEDSTVLGERIPQFAVSGTLTALGELRGSGAVELRADLGGSILWDAAKGIPIRSELESSWAGTVWSRGESPRAATFTRRLLAERIPSSDGGLGVKNERPRSRALAAARRRPSLPRAGSPTAGGGWSGGRFTIAARRAVR